ncbi:MAG: DedA family protein [Candidatus Omnitrophica bacterium]|nr:DedA family protein [Candidatus Omnitrophota bacterium]
MEWCVNILDFFIHLDRHISEIIGHYGAWTYLIVFLIVFCETGLVVTPFLPGDSLLFILGTFAAAGPLDVKIVAAVLAAAAIFGNSVNYWIGHCLAPNIFRQGKIGFIKREYLERTERFYEKYGGKTIVITRFVPIVRTIAPFLAGVGSMRFGRFTSYNVAGGLLWVCSLVGAGYLFGNIPVVEKNFTLVVYLIIVISFLPAAVEFYRHRTPKIRLPAAG